jgi:hypothetical protein
MVTILSPSAKRYAARIDANIEMGKGRYSWRLITSDARIPQMRDGEFILWMSYIRIPWIFTLPTYPLVNLISDKEARGMFELRTSLLRKEAQLRQPIIPKQSKERVTTNGTHR